MKQNIIDRIHFYLGDLKPTKIDKVEHFYSSFPIHEKAYIDPFHKLLKKHKLSDRKYFLFIGDNTKEQSPACIVKSRYNSDHSVILRSINYNRHWYSYHHKPKDIPFSEKMNTVFWRGATTGTPYRPGNRFTLVKKWYSHPTINVGFSLICQEKYKYKNYVKGEAKNEDFLKYKYVLSVEGNDKDSGIQWKLNSNSLVMMAKPRCTSWLMETTLIPNYHYVLLKDDFSDLEEKVILCNEHPKECKEIIRNANLYMKQFSDEKLEQQIEDAVIQEYFKRVV